MVQATVQNSAAIPQLGVASRTSRGGFTVGAAVAALLLVSTFVAHAHPEAMGPEVKPFLPIVATVWAFAELITAFLLLSQFYVAGKVSFAVIAAGYAVTGLLTIPYLIFFPGVFGSGPYSRGDLQVSASLWVAWHLLFPLTIALAHVIDGSLDRVTVRREKIGKALVVTVACVLTIAAGVSAAFYVGRAWLPVDIVAGGRFTPIYSRTVIPIVVLVNACSLGLILTRARRVSPLQIWLGVALLTMTLDALLNIWAPARYSIVWYVGKSEALLTSSAVLAMLLLEVATLYRRLYDVASIDMLTGLPNRRSLDERIAKVMDGASERTGGVALFVVDIDFFKGFNDRYGHAAGDAALASVASALASSVLRADDIVARFGGEEFVIFLPGVFVHEAQGIAERARACIADLNIPHEASPNAYLTVSIGVAYCSEERRIGGRAMFDFADRALYEAKGAGRNRVVTYECGDGAEAEAALAPAG